MALLGNYSVILKTPATFIGGTQVSNARSAFNMEGQMLQMYYGDSLQAPRVTNLVPNGDFERYPAFYAPTSTGSTVINGTATGGSTDTERFLWRWGKSGTAEAYYDTSTKYAGSASMKLSTKAVASYVELYLNVDGLATNYAGRVIPITPDATYTYSFMMKTNYVSGDATQGAAISFIKRQSDGTTIGSSAVTTTYIKTTTDWTRYTGTITTSATDAYICISARVYGHSGTGTLIMDAWFDDIQIYLTNQVTSPSYEAGGGLPLTASLDTGTEPPYSWHLAEVGGELSSTTMINGTATMTASQQNGINIVSSIAGVGTIDTAGLSLVTSMISTIAGTGALTGSMVGTIQMAADLAGAGDISGSLGMLSGMVATLAGSGLISSDLKGKLFMEAQIYVNEGAATVDQIVDGVVDGIGSVTATIPELLDTETGSIIIPLD